MSKSKIGNILLLIALLVLLFGCGSVNKNVAKKDTKQEVIVTQRDSLIVTHEKKETLTERIIERIESADNYKRTDRDGTIHEYYNYSTDNKTIEGVKELIDNFEMLEIHNAKLFSKLDKSEKETIKLRKQLDFFILILQVAGGVLVIYFVWVLYKKTTL